MNEKLCRERYAPLLSEIHEGLCSLLSRTRDLKTLYQSPGELKEWVRSAAQIRQLLAELERMKVLSRDDALGRSLSDLKRQFLDLEGVLKERRNDRFAGEDESGSGRI